MIKRENADYDRARTIDLGGLKIHVVRFKNNGVINSMQRDLQKIEEAANMSNKD